MDIAHTATNFSYTFLLDELPISYIFSCVFPHDPSELTQRFWCFGLVLYRNSGVVTEINSTDGEQMLHVVVIDHGSKVIFDGFIPAIPHVSAV